MAMEVKRKGWVVLMPERKKYYAVITDQMLLYSSEQDYVSDNQYIHSIVIKGVVEVWIDPKYTEKVGLRVALPDSLLEERARLAQPKPNTKSARVNRPMVDPTPKKQGIQIKPNTPGIGSLQLQPNDAMFDGLDEIFQWALLLQYVKGGNRQRSLPPQFMSELTAATGLKIAPLQSFNYVADKFNVAPIRTLETSMSMGKPASKPLSLRTPPPPRHSLGKTNSDITESANKLLSGFYGHIQANVRVYAHLANASSAIAHLLSKYDASALKRVDKEALRPFGDFMNKVTALKILMTTSGAVESLQILHLSLYNNLGLFLSEDGSVDGNILNNNIGQVLQAVKTLLVEQKIAYKHLSLMTILHATSRGQHQLPPEFDVTKFTFSNSMAEMGAANRSGGSSSSLVDDLPASNTTETSKGQFNVRALDRFRDQFKRTSSNASTATTRTVSNTSTASNSASHRDTPHPSHTHDDTKKLSSTLPKTGDMRSTDQINPDRSGSMGSTQSTAYAHSPSTVDGRKDKRDGVPKDKRIKATGSVGKKDSGTGSSINLVKRDFKRKRDLVKVDSANAPATSGKGAVAARLSRLYNRPKSVSDLSRKSKPPSGGAGAMDGSRGTPKNATDKDKNATDKGKPEKPWDGGKTLTRSVSANVMQGMADVFSESLYNTAGAQTTGTGVGLKRQLSKQANNKSSSDIHRLSSQSALANRHSHGSSQSGSDCHSNINVTAASPVDSCGVSPVTLRNGPDLSPTLLRAVAQTQPTAQTATNSQRSKHSHGLAHLRLKDHSASTTLEEAAKSLQMESKSLDTMSTEIPYSPTRTPKNPQRAFSSRQFSASTSGLWKNKGRFFMSKDHHSSATLNQQPPNLESPTPSESSTVSNYAEAFSPYAKTTGAVSLDDTPQSLPQQSISPVASQSFDDLDLPCTCGRITGDYENDPLDETFDLVMIEEHTDPGQSPPPSTPDHTTCTIPSDNPTETRPSDRHSGSHLSSDEYGVTLSGHDVSISRIKWTVRGGTKESLLKYLTRHDHNDKEYLRLFLLVYQSFATPDEVLNFLWDRFHIQPPEDLTGDALEHYIQHKIKRIQKQIVFVISHWIAENHCDFNEDFGFVARLANFVLGVSGDLPEASETLLYELKMCMQQHQNEPFRTTFAAPTEMTSLANEMMFWKLDEGVVANQCALVEWKLFKAIRPNELLKQSWNKAHLKHKSPNVLKCIDQARNMTAWVVKCLLLRDTCKDRQKTLKWFIKLAWRCYQMNNFATTMALVAGFSNAAINRLHHTWEGINSSLKHKLTTMRATLAPNNNSAQYRKTLHFIRTAKIPFLGVHLTDLTFIDDGNSDNLKEYPDYVNLEKLRKTYKVIVDIIKCQEIAYTDLKYNQEIMNILTSYIDPLDEEEDYELSLKLEPRGSTADEIK